MFLAGALSTGSRRMGVSMNECGTSRHGVPGLRAGALLLLVLCVLAAALAGATATDALPNGWASRDVGRVKIAGGAAFLNPDGATDHLTGVFAVGSAGRDVSRTSDRFHFVSVMAEGDMEIVVRLIGGENQLPRMKAGVMIRASLDAKSPNAFIYLAGNGQIGFSRRLVKAEDTTRTVGNPESVPVWLKLERRGPIVSAYASKDRVHWTFVGSDVLELPATFHVGLAVTSGDAGALVAGAFDQVVVNGVLGDGGGTGSGSDGGSDGGLDGGLDGGSDGGSAPPLPSPEPSPVFLVFDAPADHDTNVDRYLFEVVLAGSFGTRVLRESVGKPEVVDGTCTIDVSALLAQLPAGKYLGRVTAVNSFGNSAYGYSEIFSLQ
jgi:hypothetical protein